MRDEIKDCLMICVMCVIFSFALSTTCSSPAAGQEAKACPVESHIKWFLQDDEERRERALQWAPIIVEEATEANFDPLLISVIISLEASYRPEVINEQSIGEVGLMQVAPRGVCGKGQDLSTPEGQIRAGVRCLEMSREACGDDLKRILTIYASGKCQSSSVRTKRLIQRRLRIYQRAVERFH